MCEMELARVGETPGEVIVETLFKCTAHKLVHMCKGRYDRDHDSGLIRKRISSATNVRCCTSLYVASMDSACTVPG